MAVGGALGLVLFARDAAALCVAGVAQSRIHFGFTWQAWRNLASTFVLCGRRGAISPPPSFCVAGVALRALGGALGLVLVARDAAALCVAGVAQSHIHFGSTWEAWPNLTPTFVLRGRPGTISDPPSFCVAGVAGVALMALGGALGLVLVACDAAALCVAGVAQSHIQWFLMPSFTHNFVTHTYIHTYMHTIFSHTFFALSHTPSFTFHFVTHNCFNFSILHRLLSLSFPVPATTFDAHYWEKLTCGVIRSFNSRNPRFLLSSLLRVLCVIPVTGDAAASCEQHPTRGKQGRAASWTWRLQKACEVLTLSDIEQTLNVTEVHYCSWLEDLAFQRKSAEYLWMLVCSAGAVHKMRFLSTWLLFLLGQHAATHTTCSCGEV